MKKKQEQSIFHDETMAVTTHGLRTPLTALHGHLETLDVPGFATALALLGCNAVRHRALGAALAQSNKVRRLLQQRFQLATLQSSDEVLHRKRLYLDELVSDAVQKLGRRQPHGDATVRATVTVTARVTVTVRLNGQAPGRLALNGDQHLIERALTNPIDNAVCNTHDAAPVRLRLTRKSPQARIAVEDSGPGLPAGLTRRLAAGLAVREPPHRRPGGAICGAIGGLGLVAGAWWLGLNDSAACGGDTRRQFVNLATRTPRLRPRRMQRDAEVHALPPTLSSASAFAVAVRCGLA